MSELIKLPRKFTIYTNDGIADGVGYRWRGVELNIMNDGDIISTHKGYKINKHDLTSLMILWLNLNAPEFLATET